MALLGRCTGQWSVPRGPTASQETKKLPFDSSLKNWTLKKGRIKTFIPFSSLNAVLHSILQLYYWAFWNSRPEYILTKVKLFVIQLSLSKSSCSDGCSARLHAVNSRHWNPVGQGGTNLMDLELNSSSAVYLSLCSPLLGAHIKLNITYRNLYFSLIFWRWNHSHHNFFSVDLVPAVWGPGLLFLDPSGGAAAAGTGNFSSRGYSGFYLVSSIYVNIRATGHR